MAQQTYASESPRSYSTWIMAVVMVFVLVVFSIAALGSTSNGDGPNPNGAQAAEPIDNTDPLVIDLQDKLAAFSGAQTFLTANSDQLQQLKDALTKVRDKIKNKDENFSGYPAGTVGRIDSVIAKIDELAKVPPLEKELRAKTANEVWKELQALNLDSVGYANCGGGGVCLDVPAVIQGKGDWCGKTSMVMAGLYYSKGAITGPLNGYVVTKDGRLTSANSSVNSGYVTDGNLAAFSGKNDWAAVSGQGSADGLYNAIKKSIQGGDPVILYTLGAFFSPGSNHIVVAVGYNDSNKTIYVNNSMVLGRNGTGTIKATNRGRNGALLTADFLYAHRGELYYNHTMRIRKAYL